MIEGGKHETKLKVLTTALLLCVSEAGHAGPVGPLTTFTAGPRRRRRGERQFQCGENGGGRHAGRIGALESGAAKPERDGQHHTGAFYPDCGEHPQGNGPVHSQLWAPATPSSEVNAGTLRRRATALTLPAVFQALQANTTGSFNTATRLFKRSRPTRPVASIPRVA